MKFLVALVGLTICLSTMPEGTLSASEAELKFIPVSSTASASFEKKSRSPRHSSGVQDKSRISNITFESSRLPAVETTRRQLVGPVEHDSGGRFTH